MDHAIPVTQARNDLLNLVDKIDKKYTRVDITKNGKVQASLVSPEYLDSLEETVYTLQHSMADIRQAEREIKKGKYVTLEEYLEEFNASKKFSFTRKSKKKHG